MVMRQPVRSFHLRREAQKGAGRVSACALSEGTD
jgi:hypothetical protein